MRQRPENGSTCVVSSNLDQAAVQSKAKYFFLVVCALGFQSCSLVLNRRVQMVEIVSLSGLKLKRVDTIPVAARDTHYINVKRGDCVNLYFRTSDSTMIRHHLRARLSGTYWLNFMVPFYTGFIVDMFTVKRFGLPAQNYFLYDTMQRTVYRHRFPPLSPGRFEAGIGWSFLNAYNNLYYAYRGTASVSGITAHGEYYMNQQHSLFMEGGIAKAGSIRESWYGKFQPRKPDTVEAARVQSYWLSFNLRHHASTRMFVGAGLALSMMQAQIVHHYRSFRDTILPPHADTTKYPVYTQSRPEARRFLKVGPVLQLGVHLHDRVDLKATWMMFVSDLMTRQNVVMANFVSFSISVDLLKRSSPREKRIYANDH